MQPLSGQAQIAAIALSMANICNNVYTDCIAFIRRINDSGHEGVPIFVD